MNKKNPFVLYFSWAELLSALLLAVVFFSGCSSPHNNAPDELLLPKAPQSVQVNPGHQRLSVQWEEVAGADSYEVVWGKTDGEGELRKDFEAAAADIKELTNETPYWVKVRSKNTHGVSSFSEPIEATPKTLIPIPLIMSKSNKLSVMWAVEDDVRYDLLYGESQDIAAAEPSKEDVTYFDSWARTVIPGLDNGTAYYVWIKVQGEAFVSEGRSGIPQEVQNPPQGFAYVTGRTVNGSKSYAMTMKIPVGNNYLDEGTVRTMNGVFVEGRTINVEQFFMAKYAITGELWYEVQTWAEGNGYSFQNKKSVPSEANANKPVTGINWRDAIVWCNAYSEKVGLEAVYRSNGTVLRDSRNENGEACDNAVMDKDKDGFRLPTEVEREYAARGGDPAKPDWLYLFAGSDNADEVAWHHGNSPFQVRDVGEKLPNSLGIFDLSGNVQEWGWDWMNWNTDVTSNTPLDGEQRSSILSQKPIAGGGVRANVTYSVVSSRWGINTTYTEPYIGFRIVRKAE